RPGGLLSARGVDGAAQGGDDGLGGGVGGDAVGAEVGGRGEGLLERLDGGGRRGGLGGVDGGHAAVHAGGVVRGVADTLAGDDAVTAHEGGGGVEDALHLEAGGADLVGVRTAEEDA